MLRDLLDDAASGPIEALRLEALRSQADATTADLARLATTAPDEPARTHATGAAEALRRYFLAIENEQLVRSAATPSPQAIADAEATRRTHARAFDAALAPLDDLVASGTSPG